MRGVNQLINNSSGESGKAIAKSESKPKTKQKTLKTPKPKVVKIEDNSPPRPKLKSKENMVNLLYDDWLETESQKNQGRDAQYQVKFPSGDVSVQGRIYGNFGVHEDRTGKTPMYNITHLASGRALNRLENEDQAKKAIIELNRSGIDWSLNEAELMKDPKMQGKMKTAKKLMDIAVESDIRVKAINSVGEELAQKKMARDEEARKPKVIPTDAEYQANLLKHLETKIFDLNLNDEGYKNALISRVTQEVKNRMNTDPDSYLANPYSLNTLVAAYLADKPDPPKFEDYVKNELPIEKSVKKLTTEAFWHFKDKKITSPLTV